jgi:hypothetical protein
MVLMKKWIYISYILLAMTAMSIVPTAAVVACDRTIPVHSGDSITLRGSPDNTDFYYYSWSDEGFTLTRDGVALTPEELGAQSITFDAPVAPGTYTVFLSVGQIGYTDACIDDYSICIVVTKPTCFEPEPYCEEEETRPEYCYNGPDNLGNTYAWYVLTEDRLPTPQDPILGTIKCFTFPETDVPDGDIYNDYNVTLVVTDSSTDLPMICGPFVQRVLEDPTAGINVGGGRT